MRESGNAIEICSYIPGCNQICLQTLLSCSLLDMLIVWRQRHPMLRQLISSPFSCSCWPHSSIGWVGLIFRGSAWKVSHYLNVDGYTFFLPEVSTLKIFRNTVRLFRRRRFYSVFEVVYFYFRTASRGGSVRCQGQSVVVCHGVCTSSCAALWTSSLFVEALSFRTDVSKPSLIIQLNFSNF